MKNKPFFLKNVQLSGYKSIKNVDIDFENGLNIIIGKNAAGKTNFLSFLDVIIKKTQKIYFDYYSKLLFFGKDEYLIEKESKFQKENNLDANFFVNEIIKKNKKKIERTQLKLFYHSTLIKHGVPENYLFVDKSFSFELSNGEIDSNLVELVINQGFPKFTSNLFYSVIYNFTIKKLKVNLKNIKDTIQLISEKINLLKIDLQKYSNINDIRLNKSYSIIKNEFNNYYLINNLSLEFKIENSWLPFSDLSDGTKRLFYIISEVAIHTDINENQLRIILLEEPELGIHPHQLHGLMQFLKEQAEGKQIIISTHSPQVLNILGKKELNKIIIATSEGKKGTVLKHLSEEQKNKAKSYMDDDALFLSDYWMYSDLEERI